jgi:hypothetical protein
MHPIDLRGNLKKQRADKAHHFIQQHYDSFDQMLQKWKIVIESQEFRDLCGDQLHQYIFSKYQEVNLQTLCI